MEEKTPAATSQSAESQETPAQAQQQQAQQAPQPQQAQQPQGEPPKSGPAIASLVLGIVAVIFCFVPVVNGLSIVCGIIGLILAFVAFSGVKKGKVSGKGLAVSGIVLNIVALAIVVIMMASCGALIAGTSNLASSASSAASSQSTEPPSASAAASSPAGTGEDTLEESQQEDEEDAVTPSFKKQMDRYEAFFDKYVKVMQKYQDDSTDLSILSDMTEMASEESKMLSDFQSIDTSELSVADAAYYAEVSARITKKLSKVM